MFEKTLTTLLDMLGLATITAIAISTSITAYSTVVTPFCRLRFASDIGSITSLFRIVSLDSMSVYLLRCWGCPALPLPHPLPLLCILEQRLNGRNRQMVPDACSRACAVACPRSS